MYLSKQELKELHAYVNYSPRNLTVMESHIKDLKLVAEMPMATDLLRARKHEIEAKLIRSIQIASSNDTKLMDRCKKALVDKDALENLLESFPYVQFEKLIYTGKINTFQRLYHEGGGVDLLKKCADWLNSFLEIVSELPTDVQCFVKTPDTDRKAISKHNKKNKGTHVRPLQPNKQEILNELLGPKNHKLLQMILSHRLYNEIPEIERRLNVEIVKGIRRDNKLFPFFTELFKEEYMDYLEVSAHVQTEAGDIHSMNYKFAIPQFRLIRS